MRLSIGLLLVLTTLWGCNRGPEWATFEFHIPVPPQDSLDAIYTQNIADLQRVFKTSSDDVDTYYHSDTLFTGWAGWDDPSNAHRYRYARYEKGELVRQIGYYSNGQLDHDFYIQNGRSIGHERMWMEDGNPYILYFYSSPGQMHGLQRRWHSNKQLAWEALYEHGKVVYSIEYDGSGAVTKTAGKLPKDKRTAN